MSSFVDTHRDTILDMLAEDPRISGQALCEVTTYAVDNILIDACEQALRDAPLEPGGPGLTGLPERWALTALGGYGRNQMCLRSDVDLQLVLPDDAVDPTPFMSALLDGLASWRLKVGHGVRTISESLMLARQEPTFATAALTSRHIIGDPMITEAVRGPIYHHLAGSGLFDLVDALRLDRTRRSERLGDTVFVLEPDLKNGIGGLRDAQLSGWLALVTGRPFDRRVMFAEDFLLKVRMALHATATFKCDRLAFEYQDPVAEALGLATIAGRSPAIELMRQVHLALRLIARRARRQIEYATDRLRQPMRLPVGSNRRFVRFGDRLARADGAPPRTAADVVDAIGVVRRTGLPLEAGLEDGFEALATYLGDTAAADPELNEMLLETLVDPNPGASTALHAMHRTGLLTAIVPEFEAIVGQVQRDLYHVYTVDEHSLRAVDRLKALARGDHTTDHPYATAGFAELQSLRALAVATLLHDIGKGYGPGHHDRGAALADTIGPRLGLDPAEVTMARLLIRHQADMAMICMRRDLSDPRPIRSLARVVGDVPTLTALYLLTISDWSSVGPETFGSWHRTLLRTLYERTRELLERPNLFSDPDKITAEKRRALLGAELGEVPQAPGTDSDPIDDFMSALPTRYFNSVPADRFQHHYRAWRQQQAQREPVVNVHHPDPDEPCEITVVCADRPGLLARLAAGLATARLSVLAAEIYSLTGGLVLDVFRVEDPHERLVDRRAAEALEVALSETVTADAARYVRQEGGMPTAAGALPPVPTQVHVSNDAASDHTVVDVVTSDRDGLLYAIASFFRVAGLSVELAFVTTEGMQARDSFYIVDATGAKLDAAAAKALPHALTAALAM